MFASFFSRCSISVSLRPFLRRSAAVVGDAPRRSRGVGDALVGVPALGVVAQPRIQPTVANRAPIRFRTRRRLLPVPHSPSPS